MWKVELFGEKFAEYDCSPLLAEKIEDATGLRWNGVGLTMSRGEVKAIRHTAAVLLAERLDMTELDALAKIDTLKVGDLLDAVTEGDDDLPTVLENGFPQSADETSTGT